MLGPKEVKEKQLQKEKLDYYNKLVSELDSGLIKTSLIEENKMHVIISGEYSKELRDIVANDYVEKGWSKVTHRTSSENGERPGLTAFVFYQ